MEELEKNGNYDNNGDVNTTTGIDDVGDSDFDVLNVHFFKSVSKTYWKQCTVDGRLLN